jgi:predicted Zn-dependent peptidase
MTIFTFLTLAAAALVPMQQEDLVAPNAFSGVETHVLPNGLKVWFKRLPDDPVVSISVALPFGADQDPPGKEQLAHFAEHMLFSDQPGLSEEEIRQQIEERGGVYNASVTSDRTFYYVRIGKEHALFALEWLHRIIAPHEMSVEVVERQRQPVALEVRARPRQFFDWLEAYYVNPPALRMPGFWEREFGLETRASRDYYPYASLNRITPEDLRWFYDSYYAPSLMTLTIIGDVEREIVFDALASSFATLPAREEPDQVVVLVDPKRYRQSILWAYRSNVYYSNRFKFYGLPAGETVKLIFVSHLLSKRLNDRLRFGERKATYGIGVGIAQRGPAAYLHVTGGISDEEFDFARQTVIDDLEALRIGSLPSVEFEADRWAVARQLRVRNSASEDLEGWVSRYFFDTRIYDDFPDLVTAFETFSQEEIQGFVAEHLVPERQVLMIIHPHPLTQGLLVVLVSVLVWLAVYLARRRLTHPIDMTRIRYVARFKVPRLYWIASTLALLILVAAGFRALIYVFQVLAYRHLVAIDSFIVQWAAYGAMLVASVFIFVLILSRMPRKILLFDDAVLVKYLSYRSVAIPAGEVDEISLLGFRAVWLTKRLWKCMPLTLGLLTPGIYLKRRNGMSYFFNVRRKEELLQVAEKVLNSQ